MRLTLSKNKKLRFIKVENDVGFKATFSNLGASIYSIIFRDREMVLVPEDIKDYISSKCYHGKTIGRIANRIQGNKVKIDDEIYTLDNDKNENTLHGGKNGLSTKYFSYSTYAFKDGIKVIFEYTMKDLEDGLPGNTKIKVIYTVLNKETTLKMEYEAETNKPTVLSLCNHAYFTLGNQSISKLSLMIKASNYLEVNPKTMIATGVKEVIPPLDFRNMKKINLHINDECLINSKTNGYDHFFYFDKIDGNIINLTLKDYQSRMDIYTNYSGVQIYTDNYPSFKMRNTPYSTRTSIAIEPSDTHLYLHGLGKGNKYHRFVIYSFKDA